MRPLALLVLCEANSAVTTRGAHGPQSSLNEFIKTRPRCVAIKKTGGSSVRCASSGHRLVVVHQEDSFAGGVEGPLLFTRPPNERGGGESSGRPVFLCRHRSASANGLSPLDAFASYRHQEDPGASPADRHSARHPTPAPHSPAERHPLPPVNGHSHSSGRSSSSSHSSSHRSSSRVDSPPSAWLDTKSVNPPLDSSGQSARLLSAVSLFCVHHLQRFIPPDQV